MFNSNKKLLQELAKDYVEKLRYYIKKEDKVATGNLYKNISPRIKRVNKQLKIFIETEPYLKYVDEGRRPGKGIPLNALSKWMRVRNIQGPNAAFLINRKIKNLGIKPTNIIANTTKYWQIDNSYTQKYEEILADDLELIYFTSIEEMGENPNKSIIDKLTNWLKNYF